MDTINWQAERSWPFRNRNRVVTLVLRLVAMEDAITPPPREFPHSTPLSTCLHNATPARSCARVRACKRGIKTRWLETRQRPTATRSHFLPFARAFVRPCPFCHLATPGAPRLFYGCPTTSPRHGRPCPADSRVGLLVFSRFLRRSTI